MTLRSLSRTLAGTVAAGALTVAASGPALAAPAPPDIGDRASTPVTTPKVAPPPAWPLNPQTLTPPPAPSPSADTGFQWDDAGIGAGGALLVIVAALGGGLAIRRRSVEDPPLAA